MLQLLQVWLCTNASDVGWQKIACSLVLKVNKAQRHARSFSPIVSDVTTNAIRTADTIGGGGNKKGGGQAGLNLQQGIVAAVINRCRYQGTVG